MESTLLNNYNFAHLKEASEAKANNLDKEAQDLEKEATIRREEAERNRIINRLLKEIENIADTQDPSVVLAHLADISAISPVDFLFLIRSGCSAWINHYC